MSRKSALNPFYPLVVLTGVAFVVTTLAYVVAWIRLQRPDRSTTVELGPVLGFFNERGELLMVVEVILLALAAFCAIGLDQWRGRLRQADK